LAFSFTSWTAEEVTVSLLLILIVAGAAAAVLASMLRRPGPAPQQAEDVRATARHWIDRLGGQLTTLDDGGNPAAKQAIADAAERYNAACAELAQARTPTQCQLASATAVEGLHYVRAARTALGIDPGPAVPEMGTQRLTTEQRVTVGGQEYLASPVPGAGTPYYYPGGMIGTRPVPAGWYSMPWWKTALVGGAVGVGSVLLMDALFGGMGGFGHHHHGHHGFGGFGPRF
jgi:hypothetical protein